MKEGEIRALRLKQLESQFSYLRCTVRELLGAECDVPVLYLNAAEQSCRESMLDGAPPT